MTNLLPPPRVTRLPELTTRATWICLAIVLLLQALLFRQFCLREVVPMFPRAFDQTAYLGIAYDLHETIRETGLRGGLASLRRIPAPQGILLEAEAALAQFLEGPGRLAALETNFAHLVLFEIALVALACWARRPALGLALCGLLTSTTSIYQEFGGMADFRLDFAAFCLFGVLVCVAIRSSCFRRTGWTVFFGVVASVLILTRTIYVVYLAPGLAALAVALLILSRIDRVHSRDARVRFVNLCLAGLVLVLIGLPSLLARWELINAYYIVTHRSAESTIRAHELGVFTSFEHLTYYARSALHMHAGARMLGLAVLVVLAVAVPGRRGRAPIAGEPTESAGDGDGVSRRDAWIGIAWLATMALTTYVVLTADISKSPVVGGVFIAMAIPPVLLLPALFGSAPERVGWRWMVCLLVFAAGQGIYASHLVRRSVVPVDGPEMRAYTRLMDDMARLSQNLGITRPVVSFDSVSEFTHPGVLKVMAYERLHIVLTPTSGLADIGFGLPSVTPAEADQQLTRSDFAVIGIDRDPNGEELYPVNNSLRKLASHLYQRADREMVRLRDASFFGRRVTLFMKPVLGCLGQSGGWMTSAGIDCQTVGVVVAARPILRVAGEGNFTWLGGALRVTARVTQDDEERGTVPCALAMEASNGATRPYTITCDLQGVRLARVERATVALTFDRSFVPKQIGINEDVRQLVLPWPRAIELLPAAR